MPNQNRANAQNPTNLAAFDLTEAVSKNLRLIDSVSCLVLHSAGDVDDEVIANAMLVIGGLVTQANTANDALYAIGGAINEPKAEPPLTAPHRSRIEHLPITREIPLEIACNLEQLHSVVESLLHIGENHDTVAVDDDCLAALYRISTLTRWLNDTANAHAETPVSDELIADLIDALKRVESHCYVIEWSDCGTTNDYILETIADLAIMARDSVERLED